MTPDWHEALGHVLHVASHAKAADLCDGDWAWLTEAERCLRAAPGLPAEFANGREPYALVATCDWGDCDEPTIAIRDNGGEWLSVCRLHVADADADAVAPIVSSILRPPPSAAPGLREALLRLVNETYFTHHTPSSESGPEEWDATYEAPSPDAIEAALHALYPPVGVPPGPPDAPRRQYPEPMA